MRYLGRRVPVVLGCAAALAACSPTAPWLKTPPKPQAAASPAAPGAPLSATGPAPAPIAVQPIAPPKGAKTAAQLDTTTAAQKTAALAPKPRTGTRKLGETVASLGAPAEPGFWLRSPLVKAKGKGRVDLGGKSIAVDLLPGAGPAGGGSQLSLAAFRALGLKLTDLPKVTVYAE